MSGKIYVLDEIVIQHSQSARLHDAYIAEYAPAARARGMHLESAWRSPPVELADRPMTLRFLWSVPDIAGWWRMRLGAARADPGLDVEIEGDDQKTQWWRFVDSIAISRKRIFMVDL